VKKLIVNFFKEFIMSLGATNPFYVEPRALMQWKQGPLSPYVDGFARRLWQRGYSPDVGQSYVRSIGYFSIWLKDHDIKVKDVDSYKISDYIRNLKHHTDTVVSGAPHRLFLSYLLEIGVITKPSVKTKSKLQRIIDEYIEYLREERGLAKQTLAHRRIFTRRFLEERFSDGLANLTHLKAKDFIDYIWKHAREYSTIYQNNRTLVLKDFCKFLYLRNYISKDIASCFPKMPYWKISRIPYYIEESDVNRLLNCCERETPKGIRDYAILMLLARLGLRAGEVRNLTLDDIDWETGQFAICGKGSKRNRLPMPQDVGKAIVQYLKHGRPSCRSRHLFIRMHAPHTGFECSGAIGKIVEKGLKRANLNPLHKGPHLLRHSFATNSLRKGASLPEISELLGHECPSSTLVYAQLDLNEIKMVAQPWPGGVK
jgi:site-specific recombinase XerD